MFRVLDFLFVLMTNHKHLDYFLSLKLVQLGLLWFWSHFPSSSSVLAFDPFSCELSVKTNEQRRAVKERTSKNDTNILKDKNTRAEVQIIRTNRMESKGNSWGVGGGGGIILKQPFLLTQDILPVDEMMMMMKAEVGTLRVTRM